MVWAKIMWAKKVWAKLPRVVRFSLSPLSPHSSEIASPLSPHSPLSPQVDSPLSPHSPLSPQVESPQVWAKMACGLKCRGLLCSTPFLSDQLRFFSFFCLSKLNFYDFVCSLSLCTTQSTAICT